MGIGDLFGTIAGGLGRGVLALGTGGLSEYEHNSNQQIAQVLADPESSPGAKVSSLAQIGTGNALAMAQDIAKQQPWFNPLTPKDAAMYGAQMYSANPLANTPPNLAQLSQGIMPGSPQAQAQQPVQGAPQQVDPRTLSGDDFLEYARTKFGPGFANEVKAIAEGKQQPPTPGSRGALAGLLTQAVMQYKPDFDAANAQTNFKNRQQTTTEFTKGEAAKAVRSIGTASNHLAHLTDQIDLASGMSFTPANWAINTADKLTGGSGPTRFDQTADALAGELGAVYKGSGHNSDTEIKTMRGALDTNASKEQKYGALENGLQLMRGRATELAQQYNTGMGLSEGDEGYKTPDDFLSPEAKQNIAKAQAKIQAFKSGTATKANIPAAAPQAQSLSNLTELPQGYRDLGNGKVLGPNNQVFTKRHK